MTRWTLGLWGGFWQLFDPLLGDVELFLLEYE